MRSKDIGDLARRSNLISGIHNYCDRWCERCPYTARCLVYATEEADLDDNPASRDISNAAFWQKLAAIFQETHELVSEWARENGVDLSPDLLAEVQAKNDRQRAEAGNHPLAVAAEQYAWNVDEWFKHNSQPVEVFSDAGAVSDETLDEADAHDYLEVIRWYQFFIVVKIIRGLLSRIDEDEYPDEEESRDSDGSVKVALIGIDRSLVAWMLLRESHGNTPDSIQKFIFHLEKLRLFAEKEFPAARDFIRPGFDESLDKLH